MDRRSMRLKVNTLNPEVHAWAAPTPSQLQPPKPTPTALVRGMTGGEDVQDRIAHPTHRVHSTAPERSTARVVGAQRPGTRPIRSRRGAARRLSPVLDLSIRLQESAPEWTLIRPFHVHDASNPGPLTLPRSIPSVRAHYRVGIDSWRRLPRSLQRSRSRTPFGRSPRFGRLASVDTGLRAPLPTQQRERRQDQLREPKQIDENPVVQIGSDIVAIGFVSEYHRVM